MRQSRRGAAAAARGARGAARAIPPVSSRGTRGGDPSLRNIHVAPAAATCLCGTSTWHPRRRRVSAEYPRRTRGAAATVLRRGARRAVRARYPLRYTELYEEFKRLYEGLLETYIDSEGSSVAEFYAELRAATERDEESSEAIMGQIMLATTDFDVFMLMMRDARNTHDTAPSHK